MWDEGSKQNGCLPLKIEKPSYSYEFTKITKYNTNIAFFGHNNKIHNSAENKRTKANYLNQKPKRLGERATVVLSEHQVLQSQKYHKIKPVWRSQKTVKKDGKNPVLIKWERKKKNIVLCWAGNSVWWLTYTPRNNKPNFNEIDEKNWLRKIKPNISSHETNKIPSSFHARLVRQMKTKKCWNLKINEWN